MGRKRANSRRYYPWRQWFATAYETRLPIRLARFVDYRCRTDSMAELAYKAAGRLNLRIAVAIAADSEALSIQVRE